MLRDTSTAKAVALTKCPTCQRPLRGGDAHENADPLTAAASADDVESGFVNPHYFRMLRDITDGNHPTAGATSSPGAAWAQSIADGSSGDSSNSSSSSSTYPPPPTTDAEFVSSAPASPGATQGISSTAFSPNYFQRFFIEEGELGRGGRGVVLLVKHVLDGVFLGHFACKRVPVGDDHDWLEKVLVEVQLLQHLSHQNLVSYRHVWLEDVQFTKFGPSVPCAFILQQYCNAGDLYRYIRRPPRPTTPEDLKGRIRRRSKGQLEHPHPGGGPESDHPEAGGGSNPRRLSFDEIYSFFRDIASGLKHLHAHGFIHRDLKPSNCLLHDTGQEIRVLVSDFGEAQSESISRKSTGTTGTISYCAPEVLKEQYPGGPLGNFSAKSDIFSLGMILYFMCFASLPYVHHHAGDGVAEEDEGEDVEGLKEEISHWGGFDFDDDNENAMTGGRMSGKKMKRTDLPDKLYKFLKRLLAIEPSERPSAEEILRAISTGEDGYSSLGHGHGHGKRNVNVNVNGPPTSTTTAEMIVGEDGMGVGVGETRPRSGGSWWRRGMTTTTRKKALSPSPSSSSSPGTIPTHSHSSTNTGTTTDEGTTHHHHLPTPSTLTSNAHGNGKEKGIIQGGLVLRRSSSNNPSSSSSPSIPTSALLSNHPSNVQTKKQKAQPLPLPSIEPSSSNNPATGRLWSSILLTQQEPLWKTAIFLFKIFSLITPCAPMSGNPKVVWPLIFLAVVDLSITLDGNGGGGRGVEGSGGERSGIVGDGIRMEVSRGRGRGKRRVMLSMGLLVVHLFWLWMAKRWGVLCSSSSSSSSSSR